MIFGFKTKPAFGNIETFQNKRRLPSNVTEGLEEGEKSVVKCCVCVEVLELLIDEFLAFLSLFWEAKMIGEGKKATCTYRIANRNNWTGIINFSNYWSYRTVLMFCFNAEHFLRCLREKETL